MCSPPSRCCRGASLLHQEPRVGHIRNVLRQVHRLCLARQQPVFPLRVFRHSAIYVCTHRGIFCTLKDLEGSACGNSGNGHKPLVLHADFCRRRRGLTKHNGCRPGMNDPGREEKVEFKLPEGMQYQQRHDTSISAMRRCRRDRRCNFCTCPKKGGGKSRRLYPDYRAEETQYHTATGIYPIMHVVAMRRVLFGTLGRNEFCSRPLRRKTEVSSEFRTYGAHVFRCRASVDSSKVWALIRFSVRA